MARKPLPKNNVVLFFLSKLMAHVLIRFAFRVWFAVTRLDAKLQWN